MQSCVLSIIIKVIQSYWELDYDVRKISFSERYILRAYLRRISTESNIQGSFSRWTCFLIIALSENRSLLTGNF